MNYYDSEKIIPYIGIGDIKLGMNRTEIKTILKGHNIVFSEGIDSNKGCTPPIPWITIYIKDYMSLVFAEDILWEINFDEQYKGTLYNGIHIGMSMETACMIDNSITFEDFEEYWFSKNGYWLFDYADTHIIYEMSIFIKECENDDIFDKYDWIKKYK